MIYENVNTKEKDGITKDKAPIAVAQLIF